MFVSDGFSLPPPPATGLYQGLEKNHDRMFAQFKRDPRVQRAVAEFKERVAKVDSLDEFVKDYKVYTFTLTAFQLEEKADAPGFMKKILGQDLNDDKSYVNRLVDPRFKQMAKTFDFEALGVINLKDPKVIDQVVEGYLVNEFEKRMGEQNPALREAMYFKRNASQVTSVYQILSDKTLSKVVRVGLGLPEQMAYLDAKKQAAMIEKRLDVKKLSDPRFVDRLLRQYVARVDAQANSAQFGSTSMASLIQPLANPYAGRNFNILV